MYFVSSGESASIDNRALFSNICFVSGALIKRRSSSLSFVTSGAGGYYHPGIAVGILQQVTGDGGIAAVISDPAATDYVAVEPIWQPAAIKAAQTPVERAIEE